MSRQKVESIYKKRPTKKTSLLHVIPQNIFLMQNKIFISFPTKIKNTTTENKKCISIFFFNFRLYVDHTIIYNHLCQKSPGRNFKKENKVAIFTFFEVF